MMTTDSSIRLATEKDLDALVDLAIAFRDHLEQADPAPEQFRAGFAQLLNDRSAEVVLASRADGQAVGYAEIRFTPSTWSAGPRAELESLFVGRGARGHGVGRQLVEFAVARAAQRGCGTIGLNTNERNEAAVSLYERLGFRCERARWRGGRQLWFERALDPASGDVQPAARSTDPLTLEVYFDYISPFAYIASEILETVAARHRARLAWKPIELLRLSNFASGPPYTDHKRAYVAIDAMRTARYYGVAISPPKPFPVLSHLALRVALVAQSAGNFARLHHAIFRAAWNARCDIGTEAVLADCIAQADGDPGGWLARARTTEVELQLAALTSEAEQRGVFGIPTVVLDGELFWGVDSFPTLEWRLRQLA